jgi:hypothetical protein
MGVAAPSILGLSGAVVFREIIPGKRRARACQEITMVFIGERGGVIFGVV